MMNCPPSNVAAPAAESQPSKSFISRSGSKRSNTLASKSYKQASALFLTRRLPEALRALTPLLHCPQPVDEIQAGTAEPSVPPIATTDRSTRVKVWKLYLTVLNAVIELGYEEGKHAFGSQEWMTLAAKVHDGTIWDDVVRVGYHGIEGSLDPDVVTNLITLLLSQSPSQITNQRRIEAYLAASSHSNTGFVDPSIDTSHESTLILGLGCQANGTNTPQDLDSHFKILELYVLHVLPVNDELEYAKEFINMSEVLDEDRREYLLRALHDLEDERRSVRQQDAEVLADQDEQHTKERYGPSPRELAQGTKANDLPEIQYGFNGCRRSDGSQRDYGIDEFTPVNFVRKHSDSGYATTSRPPRESQAKFVPTPRTRTHVKREQAGNLSRRCVALLATLQQLIARLGQSVSKSPYILLRTIFLLVAVISAFGRRDIRQRLDRIRTLSWDGLRRTVGAGVKVSYL